MADAVAARLALASSSMAARTMKGEEREILECMVNSRQVTTILTSRPPGVLLQPHYRGTGMGLQAFTIGQFGGDRP